MKKLLIGTTSFITSIILMLMPYSVLATGVAFDAAASAFNNGTTNNFSQTVTGSNMIMFVVAVTSVNSAADVISGITATKGGVDTSMSRIDTFSENGQRLYIYHLEGVDTGTNNIKISASASGPINGYSITYSGAAQTGQPDNHTTQTGNTAGDTTVSITTVANNSVPTVFVRHEAAGDWTMDANQFQRFGANSGTQWWDKAAVTPAGSVTLGGTPDMDGGYGMLVESIAPATASVDNGILLMLGMEF